jgi:CRISPR-associated protein (TIGR02584 family)
MPAPSDTGTSPPTPEAAHPASYPHRVLVVVSGMSPQVLTETLHALAVARTPAFVPTEVHLLSTGSGASHARLTLLKGKAQFLRLCADYGIDPAIFVGERIHVITDADGRPLDDIRTAADNEAAADFITGFIQQQAARADAALHVSMAGGRKTMGYYAGYALSLYGREQDRLSHVLVSEGFEGHQDFYYPTPASTPIYREGKPALDAREARVELAEIPFVRMREELTAQAMASSTLYTHGFRDAVARANRARQPPVMRLDLERLEFSVGEQSLAPLGTRNLAFLSWLALRQARGNNGLAIREILDSGEALACEFAEVCRRLQAVDERRTAGARDQGQPARLALPQLSSVIEALEQAAMDRSDFDYRRSKLNSGLCSLLGRPLATHFLVQNVGSRGHARYMIKDVGRQVLVTDNGPPSPPARPLAPEEPTQ